MESLDHLTGYLAPEGFIPQLAAELGPSATRYDRLMLTKTPSQSPLWVQNVWQNPMRIPIASIGDAVKALRGLQRNWALYPFREHRRALLIAEQLPKVPNEPLVFPSPLPKYPLGSWTLLDRNTLLASPNCSSRFPHGEVPFAESQSGPPGRAYLKLWEALTLLQNRPQPGDRCLEIGASPGSWTWVLSQCGAKVLAVDRAPLDPSVMAMPGVTFEAANAFAMTPERVGPIDWLFSDVICYPEKLLPFVQQWLDSGLCRHFVCTLKFQGAPDYSVAHRFAAIPGSYVCHLSHNKHELTWMKDRSQESGARSQE